jgi:ribosomal protein L24
MLQCKLYEIRKCTLRCVPSLFFAIPALALVFCTALQIKKTIKRSEGNPGGIVSTESPLHYSNVQLIDPITNSPVRVTWRYLEDGSKVSSLCCHEPTQGLSNLLLSASRPSQHAFDGARHPHPHNPPISSSLPPPPPPSPPRFESARASWPRGRCSLAPPPSRSARSRGQ